MLLLVVPTLACAAPRTLEGIVRSAAPASAGRPYAVPGSAEIEANWKERLAQPYVYLEHRGDYRRLGDGMRRLFQEVSSSGLEPSGAPFALFFDDPGRVAVSELRARVCIPVESRPAGLPADVEYDVLPRSMVVYARVSGAYPSVVRAYPALFEYLRELGWRQGGPIREVYLVNPVEVESYEELQTEIQIPWIAGA